MQQPAVQPKPSPKDTGAMAIQIKASEPHGMPPSVSGLHSAECSVPRAAAICSVRFSLPRCCMPSTAHPAHDLANHAQDSSTASKLQMPCTAEHH